VESVDDVLARLLAGTPLTEWHENGPRGGRLRLVTNGATRGGPMDMLHADSI
jgi:hypothetical protein